MNKITQSINGATISLSSGGRNSEGRTVYGYEITLPCGYKYHNNDLKSGCQGGNLKKGMASLLSFLSAAGESFNYAERMGKDGMDGENSDMFPREISEWASNNCDELTMAGMDIGEGGE